MGILKTLTVNGVQYSVTPIVPADSVTLLASAWVGEGDMCSQVVEVPGVTAHTKVDLQPTAEQLAEFHYKVLAFVAENDNGVITVYSIGDKPTGDHTIQITKTEVEGTGRIRGNTVDTTTPRPDWNQTDPTKADYILNKPDDGPAIVCEENRSIITLNDASDRLLKGLTLYGKTTRLSTTGKNLFGGDLLADKLVEVASATKDETAGTVRYAAASASSKQIFKAPDQTKRYTVILYGKNTTNTTPRVNLSWYYSDGTSDVFNFKMQGTLSYCVATSSASKQVVALYGYNSSGSVILHYDKCGIFEGVATVNDFEPYTGGEASPSVNYPQDMVHSGVSGEINTGVTGKNLFDPSFFTKNGFTETDGVYSGTTSYLYYAGINNKVDRVSLECKENTRYTFSCKSKSPNSNGSAVYLYVNFVYKDGTTSALSIKNTEEASNIHTTTSGKTLSHIMCSYGTANTADFWNVQLEEGTAATTFEPYNGQTLTASTPNGLPGIPVTSGGNYTDENGQQWVCDEIDFARGVRITRLAELVFDGVSNNRRIYSTDPTQLEAAKTSIYAYINYAYILPNAKSNSKILSNYSGVNLTSAISISRTKAYLGLPEGQELTTSQVVAAFNTKLKELYDGGAPVCVLYQRTTPIETALTAEELAAYAAMHTNKPNTTVYNDAGAGMKLQYVADTKLYIDNKFNELATALVNNT